jgi:DMSO/TMAO reductase YedYZ molybdopterin-dependent catalytic subunit
MIGDDQSPPGAGGRRDKLIARKEQWARDGRLLTGNVGDPRRDRLPPGQSLVRDWPVLDLGIQPSIGTAQFRLDIDGAVEHRQSLSWDEFQALPRSEAVSDMHCVTQWSRYDNHWGGVASSIVLDLVRPLPGARHVIFHAHDGYTTNVRLEQFADPAAMLVDHWDGKPLDTLHGGPLRVLIPALYLWKSAKWVRRIELVEFDQPGFWETRGYHNNADPWREERYGDQTP